MALPPKVYQFLVSVFASLGSFLYGYDLGVIAEAIASENFIRKFGNNPNELYWPFTYNIFYQYTNIFLVVLLFPFLPAAPSLEPCLLVLLVMHLEGNSQFLSGQHCSVWEARFKLLRRLLNTCMLDVVLLA